MAYSDNASSLGRQMSFIILTCWLLPMVLAAAILGGYLAFGLGRQTEQAMAEQFQLNLQMGADRVDSAIEASRLPSYDPDLREAWSQYERDGFYPVLYRRASALFTRLYQADSLRGRNHQCVSNGSRTAHRTSAKLDPKAPYSTQDKRQGSSLTAPCSPDPQSCSQLSDPIPRPHDCVLQGFTIF